MRTTFQFFLTIGLQFLWMQPPASSQQGVPLPLDVILRGRTIAELSSLEFSPDGKWLAYVVKDSVRVAPGELADWMRTGVPRTANGCDVWLVNVETGEDENLSGGKADNWLPKWSPDGRYLAFLSDRGGNQAQLWVWDRALHSLKKVSKSMIRAEQIEWTEDGRGLVLTTVPAGMTLQEYLKAVEGDAKSAQVEASAAQAPTVRVFQSVSRAENGGEAPPESWNLNVDLRDLSLIEFASGHESTLIPRQRIKSCTMSPNGRSVACSISTRFERPGSQQVLYDLWSVDLATGRKRTLVSDIPLAYDAAEFSWSPDSKLLSYHTGWTSGNDGFVVPADGGDSRNVTNFPTSLSERYKLSIPLWDDRGNIYLLRGGSIWVTSPHQDKAVRLSEITDRRALMMISQSGNRLWTNDTAREALVLIHDDQGKQDGFYGFNLDTGQTRRLLERGECYLCGNMAWWFAAAAAARTIAYLSEDAQHGPEIWVSDGSFRSPHPLSSFHAALDRYQLGRAQLIDWLSDDGDRLHGALLLPSGYTAGKRYPLVVWVYGGGLLSDNFDRFGLGYGGPLNFQLLATRGFAVLLPDSPQREPTPVSDLVKTVLPAINRVVELGIADSAHLAVMGLSNGGYSTLALIGQTRRFQCAIEMDGMGDLTADYGAMGSTGTALAVSILEHGQDAMGGPPWQYPLRYLENSPLFYLDRVETPLLMIQGGKDSTVPAFLGDEVFVALRRLGKDVEYRKYEGEDHSPLYWSYANQLDLCNRLLAWLEKYLVAHERDSKVG
jgi:dipeptidyl aminopeptidase/acylaminoacyl peptidase